MKRGFMSTLVLMILQKESAHGYKIIKQIEERTLGTWIPTAASMYPLLKSLADKKLIQIVEPDEINAERSKKIYEITHQGQKALEILISKQQEMMKSMSTIISSTFGQLDNDATSEDFFESGPAKMFSLDASDDKSTMEQIEFLGSWKQKFQDKIKWINGILQDIDEKLLKIKEK